MSRQGGSDRRHVAEALAGAFLAGAWEPPEMARRGRRALGDRRGWVLALARAAGAGYPERPADRPRELATFLAACEPFAVAFADPARRPTVRVWMAAPTEMAAPGAASLRLPAGVRLPPIPDLDALARWLGVSPRHLEWFADRRSMERTARDEKLRHHHRRWIAKADGSARLLESPKRELKDMQRQVLQHILHPIPLSGAAHGFRPGHSVLTAARAHVGRAVVVRLDLEAFFATVRAGRVHGIFRLAGYPEPVAHSLTGLCTTTTPLAVRRLAPPFPDVGRSDRADRAGRPDHNDRVERIEQRRRLLGHLAVPHLAQGAPTSPALANLVAYTFDRRVAGLARRYGATYTRYADDLVLSGDRGLLRSTDRLVDLVGAIARDEGLRLNARKTRVRSAAQRQAVTGLVVNRRVNVPRAEYDRLRAVLDDAARSGPGVANRSGHPDFRSHLLGRISWVGTDNPTRTAKLQRAFAAIRWPDDP